MIYYKVSAFSSETGLVNKVKSFGLLCQNFIDFIHCIGQFFFLSWNLIGQIFTAKLKSGLLS